MPNYHIHPKGITITGDTLQDAVVRNIATIGRLADLGNAAGYKITRMFIEPGPANATIGAKPYTILSIDAVGLDLAHKAAPTTPARSVIFFEGVHITERVILFPPENTPAAEGS